MNIIENISHVYIINGGKFTIKFADTHVDEKSDTSAGGDFVVNMNYVDKVMRSFDVSVRSVCLPSIHSIFKYNPGIVRNIVKTPPANITMVDDTYHINYNVDIIGNNESITFVLTASDVEGDSDIHELHRLIRVGERERSDMLVQIKELTRHNELLKKYIVKTNIEGRLSQLEEFQTATQFVNSVSIISEHASRKEQSSIDHQRTLMMDILLTSASKGLSAVEQMTNNATLAQIKSNMQYSFKLACDKLLLKSYPTDKYNRFGGVRGAHGNMYVFKDIKERDSVWEPFVEDTITFRQKPLTDILKLYKLVVANTSKI